MKTTIETLSNSQFHQCVLGISINLFTPLRIIHTINSSASMIWILLIFLFIWFHMYVERHLFSILTFYISVYVFNIQYIHFMKHPFYGFVKKLLKYALGIPPF